MHPTINNSPLTWHALHIAHVFSAVCSGVSLSCKMLSKHVTNDFATRFRLSCQMLSEKFKAFYDSITFLIRLYKSKERPSILISLGFQILKPNLYSLRISLRLRSFSRSLLMRLSLWSQKLNFHAKNLESVTNLLGSSIFFSINCFFQTGMAAILRSSSSLALFCIASFLPFSAAFLAIISRFHLGISAPLGSWVGTCKDFSDHYTICPSQQIRDGRILRWAHCSYKV